MKKITKAILSVAVAGAMVLPVAAVDISVQLDGNMVDFTDALPEITNSRTMVPFRAMAEAMGYTVGWDDAAHRVTAEHDGRTLSFSIGDNKLYIRETPASEWETLDMDVAPYINYDRTYVPVRFFAEAFGQTVKWDDDNKTAVIYDEQGMIDEINKKFTMVNSADAAEKNAEGSKTYLSYSYSLPGSDEILALISVSTERGGDKLLYEMNVDFSNYLAMYGNIDGVDSIFGVDESINALFGKYEGISDYELDASKMADPDVGYDDGIWELIDENGTANLSMIIDGTTLYVHSSQLDAVLSAGIEGGETGDQVWIKLPATRIGYTDSTIGGMLFNMFENMIPSEIVNFVNTYVGYLDYLTDANFTQTDDGWTLDYSKDGLTATGSVSADFSTIEYEISRSGEDYLLTFGFWAEALDYAPEFEPGGVIIDLTDVDLLG